MDIFLFLISFLYKNIDDSIDLQKKAQNYGNSVILYLKFGYSISISPKTIKDSINSISSKRFLDTRKFRSSSSSIFCMR